MSDDDLRALERRARQTRSPADRAAWVRERLRAGQLAPGRVALAAALGEPLAVELARELGLEVPPDAGGAVGLTRLAALGGGAALVRPGVVLARPWGPEDPAERELFSAGVARVERWVVEPTEELALQAAVHDDDAALEKLGYQRWHLTQVPQEVHDALDPAGDEPAEGEVVERVEDYHALLAEPWVDGGQPDDEVAAAVQTAREELAAWAVGLDDPVQARVAARAAAAEQAGARWAASGAAADGADLLGARFRAGLTTRRAIELTAELGFEPARLALSRVGGAARPEPASLTAWATVAAQAGHFELAWGAARLARATLDAARSPEPAAALVNEVLDAVQRCVKDPAAEHHRAVWAALSKLDAAAPDDTAPAVAAARAAARAVRGFAQRTPAGEWEGGERDSAWVIPCLATALQQAARVMGEGAARGVVLADLAPWVLELRDPPREG